MVNKCLSPRWQVVNESAYPERTPVTSTGGGYRILVYKLILGTYMAFDKGRTRDFEICGLRRRTKFCLLVQHRGTEEISRGLRGTFIFLLVNHYSVRTIILCWYTWYFTGWKIIQYILTPVKKNLFGTILNLI